MFAGCVSPSWRFAACVLAGFRHGLLGSDSAPDEAVGGPTDR